ncbi:MAG: ABC transporter substrate-binding protein [Rhodospirillales bacterium]
MPHAASSSLIRWLVVAVLSGPVWVTPLRAGGGPAAMIEDFHATLLEVMKRAEDLGVDGRYRVLEPRVRETYDFPRMIRIAAGPRWTRATPEEQDALLAAFAHFSVGTYAARFDGYAGERFETLGERPGPRETVLVDTRIVRTDAPAVALTYVVERRDDRWRVIDVLLDGTISELAMRRSEYRTLGGSTAAGLAEALDAAAAALIAER